MSALNEAIERSHKAYRIGEDGKTLAVPEDVLVELQNAARRWNALINSLPTKEYIKADPHLWSIQRAVVAAMEVE